MAERLHAGEQTFRGIPVAAGVCRGKLLVLDKPRHAVAPRQLSDNEVLGELERLEIAFRQTRQQFSKCSAK